MTAKFIRASEWNGIKNGNAVKVRGVRGDFHFIAAVIYPSGVINVEVYGGKKGRKMIRVFDPAVHEVVKEKEAFKDKRPIERRGRPMKERKSG